MKKKTLPFLLLAVVFSLFYIDAVYGVKELVIEKTTGQTPETEIENYINAVSSGNEEQAFALWDLPIKDEMSVLSEQYFEDLKNQRHMVTQDLIAKKVSSHFEIKKIEWWSTCCEPRIIDNSRMAGRAKFYIDLTDSNNIKQTYIFDLSVPGGYDGGLTDHYVRNWKINNVSIEN